MKSPGGLFVSKVAIAGERKEDDLINYFASNAGIIIVFKSRVGIKASLKTGLYGHYQIG